MNTVIVDTNGMLNPWLTAGYLSTVRTFITLDRNQNPVLVVMVDSTVPQQPAPPNLQTWLNQ